MPDAKSAYGELRGVTLEFPRLKRQIRRRMQGSEVVSIAAGAAAPQIRELVGADLPEEVVRRIVATAVGSFVDAVSQALQDGQVVTIRRFGRFEAFRRRPRTMMHPQSKESIDVPERVTVGFAPADPLKLRMRQP